MVNYSTVMSRNWSADLRGREVQYRMSSLKGNPVSVQVVQVLLNNENKLKNLKINHDPGRYGVFS